jgi:hypothetical protein
MGISGGPYIIRDSSLVLELDASDRNSYVSGSTTWYDLSGNNNTGSLSVTGSSPVSASYNSSNGGNIVFSGTGSLVDCGNPTTLTSINNVSVNVWFKVNAVASTFQGIVAKRAANNITNYGINLNNSLFQWYYNVIGAGNFRICSVNFSTYFTTGSWYNVSGTFTQNGANTNAVLYQNGVAIATTNGLVGNVSSTTANLTIGNDVSNEPLNGSIANVQVYNRALSASEVLQNYNTLKSRFGLT